MTLKYRAITANCGNDTIGDIASKIIAKNLQRDDADFYVINCQEIFFDKALLQLQAAAGSNYKVMLAASMETHTNFVTQFHSGKGIASFVIYKENLDVTCVLRQIVRRSNSRLAGAAYNKGGLIADIIISNSDTNDSINLQTVSGHLDSTNSLKRSKDWQNINQAISRDVTDWNSLVLASPHLRVSGYDANTRNKIINKNAVNLWQTSPVAVELQALQQVAIAGQHYSKQSTFKTFIPKVTSVPDSQRPDYACGGMLDFIGIADGRHLCSHISESAVIQIGVEAGSKRDHDVLISPLQRYGALSDFSRVKGQMVIRLSRVAPNLAKEIVNLQDSETNRTKLLDVYQLFLSPKGLLHSVHTFHLEKMTRIGHVSRALRFFPEALKNQLSTTIFSLPWCNDITLENMAEYAAQFSQKRWVMSALLNSLNECYSEAGCINRLAWYQNVLQSEDMSHGKNTSRYFKECIINEYFENYRKLERLLKNFKPGTPNERYFMYMGWNVIEQIADIAGDELSVRKFSSKSLSRLSSIMDVCAKAIEVVQDNGNITAVSDQLLFFSKNVSGKSLPGWNKLAKSLLLLAGLALVVTGVLALVTSGGSGLLIASAAGTALFLFAVGVEILDQNCKTGLAKSISEYRLAMEDLVEDDVVNDNSCSFV